MRRDLRASDRRALITRPAATPPPTGSP